MSDPEVYPIPIQAQDRFRLTLDIWLTWRKQVAVATPKSLASWLTARHNAGLPAPIPCRGCGAGPKQMCGLPMLDDCHVRADIFTALAHTHAQSPALALIQLQGEFLLAENQHVGTMMSSREGHLLVRCPTCAAPPMEECDATSCYIDRKGAAWGYYDLLTAVRFQRAYGSGMQWR